jgi:chorismate mutase/ADP-ribose pyrophosphatase YjhB (NUDIX family)
MVDAYAHILLAKRRFEPRQHTWGMVGGFIDPAETLEEGMVREIEEEVGLPLAPQNLHYLGSKKDRYQFNDQNYHTLGALFLYQITEEEKHNLTTSDDVSELLWVTSENIPWSDLAFPSTRQTLEDFLQHPTYQYLWALNQNHLTPLRNEIDKIDNTLAQNISTRQKLVQRIGHLKHTQQQPIDQPERFQEILTRLQANHPELEPNFIEKIWTTIHHNAKQIEYKNN